MRRGGEDGERERDTHIQREREREREQGWRKLCQDVVDVDVDARHG